MALLSPGLRLRRCFLSRQRRYISATAAKTSLESKHLCKGDYVAISPSRLRFILLTKYPSNLPAGVQLKHIWKMKELRMSVAIWQTTSRNVLKFVQQEYLSWRLRGNKIARRVAQTIKELKHQRRLRQIQRQLKISASTMVTILRLLLFARFVYC